jgi:hypothetical protein
MLLAAPLSRLGRLDEARASAARLMELNFSIARQLTGVDCQQALAAALTKALSVLGLSPALTSRVPRRKVCFPCLAWSRGNDHR